MQKFYFVYNGLYAYPYDGGWVEVIAENIEQAKSIYGVIFGTNSDGSANYADVFTEEEFIKTAMFRDGILGAKCHEVISMQRVVKDQKS